MSETAYEIELRYLDDRISKLEQEIERKDEALRPFVAVCDAIAQLEPPFRADIAPIRVKATDGTVTEVTLADVARARAALSPAGHNAAR